MSFWRGNKTLRVSEKLYATNRERLVEALRAKQLPKGSVVLLQGGVESSPYNTDMEDVFRRVAKVFF